MVGREVCHVARFAVMVQYFNSSACLTANNRSRCAAAVLRSMNARYAVQSIAQVDGFLPQSIAGDDFVGGGRSVQQPRSGARTAFTDDGNLFQVNRLLGFMRLGGIGVLIKRIDKTMGLSVVCVILVSHHILKGCYYITFQH